MIVRRIDEVFADENAEETVGHVAAELVVAAVEDAPRQFIAGPALGGRRRGGIELEQRGLNRLAGAGQEQLAGHHAAFGVRPRVGKVRGEGKVLALLPAIHRVVVAPRAADAQAEQRAANVLGAVARVVVTRDKSTRLAAAENVAGQLRQRLVLADGIEQVAAQFCVTWLLGIFFASGLRQLEPAPVVVGKHFGELLGAHQAIRRLGQAPGRWQGEKAVEFVRRRRTTGEVDVHPAGEHEGVRLGTGPEAKRLEAGEPGAVERVCRRRLVRRVFIERLADDGAGVVAGVTGNDPRLAGGAPGHRAVVVDERDGLVSARENGEPCDVAGGRALGQAVFRHGGETTVARLEP